MLVCAVVSPKAFEPQHFSDRAYTNQANLFLEEMLENGLLLIDCQGRLKRNMESNIDRITDVGGGHTVKAFFQEIMKREIMKDSPRKVFIRSRPCNSIDRLSDCEKIAEELAKPHWVDALVTAGHQQCASLSRSANVPLAEYQESTFRRRCKEYCNKGSGSLNTLDEKDAGNVFERIVRFSHRLSFYDKQIGQFKTIGDLRRFLRGIEYILEIWSRCCRCDASDSSIFSINIITVQRRPNTEITSDTAPPLEERDTLRAGLLQPLQKKYPSWRFRIVVKKSNPQLHDRLLDAERILIELSRGFDFFNRARQFHNQCLRISSRYDYLREWDTTETLFEIT